MILPIPRALFFFMLAAAFSYGFVYALVRTITLAVRQEGWRLWAGFTAFYLVLAIMNFFEMFVILIA